LQKDVNPNQIGSIALAFLGDAVFSLMARDALLHTGNLSPNGLHKRAISMVRASAQSEAVEKISSILTEEEEAVFKRGRNVNSTKIPKNAEALEYRRATGLEALFGYLYLKGENERLNYLFSVIFKEFE
jgi:ribonuclease-3 family protein